jgi:predicted lipase
MPEQTLQFDADNIETPGNAVFAGTLAKLSYDTEADVERQLKLYGLEEGAAMLSSALMSCVIVRSHDTTAVAFKGTTTWREWLNNANVWPEPTAQGRIHAGFLNTIQHSGPIVLSLIQKDISEGKNIVLAGHSRGGALALVFAVFLVINGHCPHSVWMFGAPRAGDGGYATQLHGIPVKHYVRRGDPVVRFPLNIKPKSATVRKYMENSRLAYTVVSLLFHAWVRYGSRARRKSSSRDHNQPP